MNHLSSHKPLEVIPFGLISFNEALALQIRMHDEVAQGKRPGCVLWGQHHAVVTFGKNAGESDLRVPKEAFSAHHIEMVHTDRGGKITFHNPGQLIVYPIIDVWHRGLGVRNYVTALEQSVLKTLARYDIQAQARADAPGVWVGNAKCAAIGVRISKRVSMHGLALNVCNDLSPYEMIVPCGIKDAEVTSMADLLGRKRLLQINEVAEALTAEVLRSLQ